jgi:transketolase
MSASTKKKTMSKANAVRKSILKMLHYGGASHLGSSMSMVEMLLAVYQACDLEKIRNKTLDRDRVIVSKGHCASAVYAAMAHSGLIDLALLDTYHHDGSLLAGHVSHGVTHVEHTTGALGHGLPVACGCAIGLRSRGFTQARVFVLLGDGELQEGSNWEALMFAHHHRLSNLVTLIDNNRISSITHTDDVISLDPLGKRFEGFGFQVYHVDGHDEAAIGQALADIRKADRPSVIICNTVKGARIPFAEHQAIWHYRTLNKELYNEALQSLEEQL